MPRPYSYDHFQVPKTLPAQKRGLRHEDKKRVSKSGAHPEDMESHGGLHYGRSHAQTEEILQARQMEAELEHLARPEPDAKFSYGRPAPSPAKRKASAPAPVIGGTAPIGALPPTREQPPRARLPDLIEEAGRQLQAIQSGLGDAVKAVTRLASLPFEVVRLAARRLRPA